MSLIVLAGPAGVGKGTLVRWLLENAEGYSLSVSATTRSPRPGEEDGVHYHFVERARFEQLIADSQLLEWATVHGDNYYGTLLDELTRADAEGLHLLLEIDLQGARQVMETRPTAITIFIHPPSLKFLNRGFAKEGPRQNHKYKLDLATQELRSHQPKNLIMN